MSALAEAMRKRGLVVLRRVVLLTGGEDSSLERVLWESSQPVNLIGKLRELAKANPGLLLAGEWKGPRGWERYIWLRGKP